MATKNVEAGKWYMSKGDIEYKREKIYILHVLKNPFNNGKQLHALGYSERSPSPKIWEAETGMLAEYPDNEAFENEYIDMELGEIETHVTISKSQFMKILGGYTDGYAGELIWRDLSKITECAVFPEIT